MQKYSSYDETGNINGIQEESKTRSYENQQVAHGMEIRARNSCPTAMACAPSGEIVFTAYSDDSLHMIDVRSPDSEAIFKSGGHSGMIKSIWFVEDENVIFTGGSDGTVRLWDIGTRSVIHTYGEDKHRQRRDSINDLVDDFPFHTDTVTTILPSTLGGKQANG